MSDTIVFFLVHIYLGPPCVPLVRDDRYAQRNVEKHANSTATRKWIRELLV